MPLIGFDNSATPNSSLGFGVGVTPMQQQQAASLSVTQDRNPLEVIGGIGALGAVDLADTVASSIPGIHAAFGVDRGDVNRRVLSALDTPGLADFYHDYKGGIEATSAVMGVVGSELIARRLTAPAGAFMGLLRELPYARRIATLDETYNNAIQAVRAVDVNLAARGAIGAEQYVGRTVVDHTIFDSQTGQFATTAAELSRSSAVNKAKLLGAAKNLVHAGITESVMATTLNQNGFLYDDSAAYNMAWQGFGLATAGAAGWLQGAYRIRKFVNSDEIRRLFANALDPEGAETARLQWHGKDIPPNENFLGGVYSDRVTNLLVNSRLLTETSHAGDVNALQLAANRERLATQWENLAQEETQKLSTRGISSNGFTRFSMDSPGYGNHVKWALRRDPSMLYGAEQIGGVSEDMSIRGVHDSHIARVQERIDQTEEALGGMLDDEGRLVEDANPDEYQKHQNLLKRLEFETTLTPMTLVDSELMPVSEAEAFDNWVEPKISFSADPEAGVRGAVKGTVSRDNHGLLSVMSENPAGGVSLDTGFIYHIPGRAKNVNNADLTQVMNLYRLGDQAIDRMRRFTGPLVLPKNPDWFQLDMAEELLRRTEGRANVVFPNGMTRDQARIEALIQKSKGVTQWDAKDAKDALKAESKGQTYEGQLSKLRLRYNLPRLTAYERGVLGDGAEHPVESLLRGIANMPEDEIRKMSLDDVQESMAQFKRVGDVAPVQHSDLEDMGGSFRFMKDENGNPVRPILIYKRPFKVAEWTSDTTAERLAAAKMWTVSQLTGGSAAPMSKAISQSILNSPDFDAASRTNELMDTQVQGGLWGASPQSQAGALGNALRTTDWRDRDNPILLAATRLRDQTSRISREYMRQYTQALGEATSALSNPRNASSKLLLNQFHTFAPGWDIGKAPVSMEGGMNGFILKETDSNKERFRTLFGREMDKSQLLLAPNGKPIVLDDMGLDIQQQFNQTTNALLDEKNTILRANGRQEIQPRDWYVPPPNTNGKLIGFTFGPDNKIVPNLSVVADSPADFDRQKQEVLKKIEELGLGYNFRTQDAIKEFANIWDRVQMDFINPGVTAVQPGKRQLGKLVGQTVNLGAFQDSMKSLQDSFLGHGTDIIQSLLREQINASKARSALSSAVTANQGSKLYNVENKNVYDMYLENLMGSSKLNQKSLIGPIYRTIEGNLDKFLSEATPAAAKTWQAVTDWVGKAKIWDNSDQARKDFQALSTKLGGFMPFDNALQLSEARGLGAAAPTLKKITGNMNRFSTALILRVLETAQPLMNLAGIINAAPAVVRNFTPMRGENAEGFAQRVGHAATIFQTPEGATYGVADINKLITNGFKRAWNRSSEADYDYMVKRGYLSLEMAEFQRQFGAIDSKNAWESFFYGDSTKKGFQNKGVVGWTGILDDRSEDFSRSWAHMIGLNVAEDLGISQQEAKHAFAHDVANKMIANYNPNNKAEIFQGALGAPIGLFQSFIVNYYERLFRYVEQGDYKALATQMATQSGLFGVTSLPGWQQYNAFMTKHDGTDDPTSSIWRRYGGNAGDLIGHGLISNLPQLFGMPGADVFSRGDVSIRQFQIKDPTSIPGILTSVSPAFNVMQKIYQGIGQGVDLFRSTNPKLTHTEVAEVLSNMIANRPLSGIIEQALAGGNHTDQLGQIVTDTKGGMEMAYRLLGVRSERQSNELQAFYANKNAMSHQAALKEELSVHTRQILRGGDMDALPQVFNAYIQQGGDPNNFRRWLKSTYIAATTTRGQRQMAQVAKDPEKMSQLLRLLDAGVTPAQDANSDQPADPDQLYLSGTGDTPQQSQ
jgi:hypothetical protein